MVRIDATVSILYSLHVQLSMPAPFLGLDIVVLIVPSDHHCLLCKAAKLWGKMCPVATRQMHGVAPNFDSPRTPPLGPSLEHAPSVPQGVGSDKLIKDVRTIMYLVCLVVLVSKE
jgi:hypothetical protein